MIKSTCYIFEGEAKWGECKVVHLFGRVCESKQAASKKLYVEVQNEAVLTTSGRSDEEREVFRTRRYYQQHGGLRKKADKQRLNGLMRLCG